MAPRILSLVKSKPGTLFEPFAGSAAVTLFAATKGTASRYEIGEILQPLADLWVLVITHPSKLSGRYRELWEPGVSSPEHYLEVRDSFNRTHDPAMFLYLMARCVKGAIRFNSAGHFNQSADKRRVGMHPDKMERNIRLASALLTGKTSVRFADYEELLREAGPNDLVYMDPPWQGTSTSRDTRYAQPLDLARLTTNLEFLNSRCVPYLLSFDGRCGDKTYGQELPEHLGLRRLDLPAGRSSQATLIGAEAHTVESLYVSPGLGARLQHGEVLEEEPSQLGLNL